MPEDLILPVFVSEVDDEPLEIASMPGVRRWPLGGLGEVAEAALGAELGALLLFGIPAEKDSRGSQASATEGVIQRAIRELRASGWDGVLITDVCLCEYTDHGHCGILDDQGRVLNDPTLERLAATALSHARSGADVVAPSAMMDGQVAAIRSALDDAGLTGISILS